MHGVLRVSVKAEKSWVSLRSVPGNSSYLACVLGMTHVPSLYSHWSRVSRMKQEGRKQAGKLNAQVRKRQNGGMHSPGVRTHWPPALWGHHQQVERHLTGE